MQSLLGVICSTDVFHGGTEERDHPLAPYTMRRKRKAPSAKQQAQDCKQADKSEYHLDSKLKGWGHGGQDKRNDPPEHCQHQTKDNKTNEQTNETCEHEGTSLWFDANLSFRV